MSVHGFGASAAPAVTAQARVALVAPHLTPLYSCLSCPHAPTTGCAACCCLVMPFCQRRGLAAAPGVCVRAVG